MEVGVEVGRECGEETEEVRGDGGYQENIAH